MLRYLFAQYQTKYLDLHVSLTDSGISQSSIRQCISYVNVSVHKFANGTGHNEDQDMSQTHFH